MNRSSRRSRRRQRGVNLLEVMVVIAIIVTLTAILAMGVFRMGRESLHDLSWMTVNQVGREVDLYEFRRRQAPEDLRQIYRDEPLPRDAWGTDIAYEPGRKWDVLSFGEDRAPGGEGPNRDLRYSEKRRP
ncbi:MAG: type II secretion system protein GspG [Myxococcota bacterium]